jgi:hypothetical protein
MATRNDVTGDQLISKSPTDSYRDGWDRIFGKKKPLTKNSDETGYWKDREDYIKNSVIPTTGVLSDR